VAYRVGDGPDAEDITSAVFERAVRYRDKYDSRKGEPAAWLIGIARTAIPEHFEHARGERSSSEAKEGPTTSDLAAEAPRRLDLRAAVSRLDARERELVALRYGADLTARQIGALLGMKTNAVEVALHRVLARLRAELADEPAAPRRLQPKTASGS
jgi:RNA polymerase sigma-70 factor (ECF subfamily)